MQQESPVQEISNVYHAQPHHVLCSPYTLVVDSDAGRSVLARGSHRANKAFKVL